MKIQRTTVIEAAGGFRVELLFSEDPEPSASTEAISIAVRLLSEDRYPRLAELQKAALQHARTAITNEIQRLELAQGHSP